MKQLIAVMLVIATLVCAFPAVGVGAGNVTDDYSFLSEDVFYTDLFSVYSTYLCNSNYIDRMNEETQGALIKTYNTFKDSDRYEDMLLATTFSSMNIKDLVKLLGDGFGISNFAYNEALDEANERFLNEMYGSQSAMDSFGTDKRMYEYVTRASKIFLDIADNIEIEDITYIEQLEIDDWLRHTEDGLGRYYDKYVDVTVVENVVRYGIDNIDKVKAAFDVGTQGIVMIKAIYLACIVEMVRGDIIDDLLQSATPGTALHDGMTRLKNRMGNNAADFIIRYYFENGLFNKFVEVAENWAIDKIFGDKAYAFNITNLVIDIASTVYFDLILDTPEFSEVTSFVILGRYANDLYYSIKAKEYDLPGVCLEPNTITRYENLWSVYLAVNKAAWKLGKKIAVGQTLKELNFIYEVYFVGDYNLYSEHIKNLIWQIESEPVEERYITPIESYQYDYSKIASANFAEATDDIEKDTIYAVNDKLYGSLKVNKRQTQSTDSGKDVLKGINGIWGDLIVDGQTFKIPADTEFEVDGNVLITGHYSSGSNYEGVLSVYGHVIVNGDVYTDTDYTQMDLYVDTDGLLCVKGDYLMPMTTYKSGTVCFCGSELQIVSGNFKNVIVKNPKGIMGDILVEGHLELNNNPQSGTITFSSGGSFDDSQLDKVYINKDCVLKSNINADVVEIYGAVLTVPKDSSYVINGDVKLGGYISGSYYKKGTLEIYGDLTVTGDIDNLDDNTYNEMKLSDDNAVLRILGDQNIGLANTYYGTVSFEGNEQQKMIGAYKNVVVTNPEGVFGDIALSGYFKLNGNPQAGRITLRSGGCFDDSKFDHIYINTDCTLKSNVSADVFEVYGAVLTVHDDSAYVIDGDVNLGGYISGSYYKKGTLEIYGDLTVTGDLDRIADNSYYELKLCDDDAMLRIHKDQKIGLSNTYYGTVSFEGKEKQKMTGAYKNVSVTNPEGVFGDIVLSGNFMLNNNPQSGTITLRSGGTFDESKFNRVYVNTDCVLKSNIRADEVEIYGKTLTVPQNEAYTVDGDIILGGYIGGAYVYYGVLEIAGDLSVTGDIRFSENNSYGKIVATNMGSTIRFAGDKAQNVGINLNAQNVYIENESQQGVTFERGLAVNGLFDHNRNTYNDNGNGVFGDFDNDGILDDLDIVPEAARGDADADGNINALDSFAIARVIAGYAASMSFETIYNADVNGDGVVNGMDSNIMKRRIAGV